MTAEKILDLKGSQVHTVRPDTTIITAAKDLRSETIGAVVVSRDGETIDGILSERDIVHALADHGIECLDWPVSKIMTRDVKTCSSKDPNLSLMALMNLNHIRHIPVVDNGKMIGLISMGDIVNRRLSEVAADAKAMREYITGTA
ncbi:MAG: CBS domain-containing protein [Rhodospirillales bacterium]|nr:CBS domain-containing protein [Rhodospirillales bacterium]